MVSGGGVLMFVSCLSISLLLKVKLECKEWVSPLTTLIRLPCPCFCYPVSFEPRVQTSLTKAGTLRGYSSVCICFACWSLGSGHWLNATPQVVVPGWGHGYVFLTKRLPVPLWSWDGYCGKDTLACRRKRDCGVGGGWLLPFFSSCILVACLLWCDQICSRKQFNGGRVCSGL